jgi:hypothetical protein
MYKMHLFHYEKLFNPATKLKLDYAYDEVAIEDLDPNYLIPIKVYYVNSSEEITDEVIQDALKQDVCIFRNYEKAVGFNKELFKPENFIKGHENEKIDIMIQDPEAVTFHRIKNQKEEMRLADYFKYQRKLEVKDENGNIKFGVNIDIGKWKPQINELVAKIPDDFLFCSRLDALQYVRQHILGMTQPQLYMKVKGSWTGGHEENLRYRAINLNHGPDSSEWC